jgi:hypothetical protein
MLASDQQLEVRQMFRARWLSTIILAALAPTVFASNLGDALNGKLKGAWAVLDVEVYSACSGSYSDNTLGDMGVASKANRRFEPGEIVKIDRLKVKRQRVDVLLTLAKPIRTSRVDGPFELFDERRCQVQLIIPVPREQIKANDTEKILDRITAPMTIYSSLDLARDSEVWNGREVRPLPDDYSQTLQLHAVWKAEQTNAEVHATAIRSLTRAADIAERIRDDDDYLEGFSAGAEKMSSLYLTDCSLLLTATEQSNRKNPPDDRSSRWKEGWEDGQDLIFNLLVAERLQACTVPIPAVAVP